MESALHRGTSYRSLQRSVRRCIELWRVYGARGSLLLFQEFLARTQCIWYMSFRSFLGHIQSQTSKGLLVDFGPSSEPGQNDAASERTIARSLYTRMLQATFPYVDSQDLRIFLMGFDAGEQWDAHGRIPQSELSGNDYSSWLTLSEKEFGNVPAILQEMRASNGHTSDAIPAAIAGVILSDECTRTKL